MQKLILSCFLLFAVFTAMAQNRVARGYVLDDRTRAPIDSAVVAVYDTLIYTYTDVTGYYAIQVPRKRRHLEVSHKDFETKRIILGPGFQQRDTEITLQSLLQIQRNEIERMRQDSAFYGYRNTLSLSVQELFAVAFAFRYERFLARNHSIGVHCSVYIYGRTLGNLGSEHDYYHEYNGFKLAPAYRFYPYRKNLIGFFLETKIPFGYINFTKLDYHSTHYTHLDIYEQYSTWTYGISLCAGFSFTIPKTKHGIITVTLGYQHFPINVPEEACMTVSDDVTLCFPTYMDWWYWLGPGSYFEAKFMIGGIF